MKFGQVWEIAVEDGNTIVVMVIAESDNRRLAQAGVHAAVTLAGETKFGGGSGFLPGVYGPGDIGPMKFKDGELVDDAKP